jgi:hypothetical protein
VITLREKKYDSNISVEAVLNAFTKPELKGLVNSLGFNLTSAARKRDFVKYAADIILNRHEIVLSKLNVESLDILSNLLHAEEGTFIACPHVSIQRDIQNLALVLTYVKDDTEYLTVSKDFRECYISFIDNYLNSAEVKIQRTIEPYILGLSNLLGLCPIPHLQDILKRDGIEVSLSDVEKCCYRVCNRPLILVQGEFAPVPYDEQYKEVAYAPSLYFTQNDDKVSKFINESLYGDGLLHKKYREFSREEILAAGHHVPDFCWNEVNELRAAFTADGYSETKISSTIVKLWQSHVYDDEENSRNHLSFADGKLQSLYENFCKVIPRWVCRGYCDTPIDGEFDESIAEVTSEFEIISETYKNLPSADSSDEKFDNVFSRNPKAKTESEDVIREVIYKRVIRLTSHFKGDIYFTGYLINEGDQSRLIANFGHVFDFITMPYSSGDCIEISRGTAKKYPTFTKLVEAGVDDKYGCTYLNTIGFNGNPKTWCLMRKLSIGVEEWLGYALRSNSSFDYSDDIDDDIYDFYNIAIKLYYEISRSDSKKAQAGLAELLK